MSKSLTIAGSLFFAGLVIAGIHTSANDPTNQPLYEGMAWGDVAVMHLVDGFTFAILAVGLIVTFAFVVVVIAIIMLLSIDRWLKPMRA